MARTHLPLERERLPQRNERTFDVQLEPRETLSLKAGGNFDYG